MHLVNVLRFCGLGSDRISFVQLRPLLDVVGESGTRQAASDRSEFRSDCGSHIGDALSESGSIALPEG
jgi:hypothetical protein